MDKLKDPKYRDHFDRITFVENSDFEDVIKKYDSPTTYFYLDPPYATTETYYSNHDFGKKDHKRLADVLNNVKGKFGLSYYGFGDLEGFYPKDLYRWESQEFKKAAAAKKDGTQNVGTEILIMNY